MPQCKCKYCNAKKAMIVKPNKTKKSHFVQSSNTQFPNACSFPSTPLPPMMPPSPPWAYDADPHNSHGPVELSNSCSMTLIAGDSVRYNLNTLGAEYKPFGSYSTGRDLSVFLYPFKSDNIQQGEVLLNFITFQKCSNIKQIILFTSCVSDWSRM